MSVINKVITHQTNLFKNIRKPWDTSFNRLYSPTFTGYTGKIHNFRTNDDYNLLLAGCLANPQFHLYNALHMLHSTMLQESEKYDDARVLLNRYNVPHMFMYLQQNYTKNKNIWYKKFISINYNYRGVVENINSGYIDGHDGYLEDGNGNFLNFTLTNKQSNGRHHYFDISGSPSSISMNVLYNKVLGGVLGDSYLSGQTNNPYEYVNDKVLLFTRNFYYNGSTEPEIRHMNQKWVKAMQILQYMLFRIEFMGIEYCASPVYIHKDRNTIKIRFDIDETFNRNNIDNLHNGYQVRITIPRFLISMWHKPSKDENNVNPHRYMYDDFVPDGPSFYKDNNNTFHVYFISDNEEMHNKLELYKNMGYEHGINNIDKSDINYKSTIPTIDRELRILSANRSIRLEIYNGSSPVIARNIEFISNNNTRDVSVPNLTYGSYTFNITPVYSYRPGAGNYPSFLFYDNGINYRYNHIYKGYGNDASYYNLELSSASFTIPYPITIYYNYTGSPYTNTDFVFPTSPHTILANRLGHIRFQFYNQYPNSLFYFSLLDNYVDINDNVITQNYISNNITVEKDRLYAISPISGIPTNDLNVTQVNVSGTYINTYAIDLNEYFLSDYDFHLSDRYYFYHQFDKITSIYNGDLSQSNIVKTNLWFLQHRYLTLQINRVLPQNDIYNVFGYFYSNFSIYSTCPTSGILHDAYTEALNKEIAYTIGVENNTLSVQTNIPALSNTYYLPSIEKTKFSYFNRNYITYQPSYIHFYIVKSDRKDITYSKDNIVSAIRNVEDSSTYNNHKIYNNENITRFRSLLTYDKDKASLDQVFSDNNSDAFSGTKYTNVVSDSDYTLNKNYRYFYVLGYVLYPWNAYKMNENAKIKSFIYSDATLEDTDITISSTTMDIGKIEDYTITFSNINLSNKKVVIYVLSQNEKLEKEYICVANINVSEQSIDLINYLNDIYDTYGPINVLIDIFAYDNGIYKYKSISGTCTFTKTLQTIFDGDILVDQESYINRKSKDIKIYEIKTSSKNYKNEGTITYNATSLKSVKVISLLSVYDKPPNTDVQFSIDINGRNFSINPINNLDSIIPKYLFVNPMEDLVPYIKSIYGDNSIINVGSDVYSFNIVIKLLSNGTATPKIHNCKAYIVNDINTFL